MVVASGVAGACSKHAVAAEAASELAEPNARHIAKERAHDGGVGLGERGALDLDLGLEPRARRWRRRRPSSLWHEPAREAPDRIVDRHAEDALDLLERREVAEPRAARRQGTARGHAVDASDVGARHEVVEQKRDLRLGPDADDAHPEATVITVLAQCVEDDRQARLGEVVETDGVDDVRLGGEAGRLRIGGGIAAFIGDSVEVEHEARARCIHEGVRTELFEMGGLRGVVGVVPVADVHDGEARGVLNVGPAHELRDGAGARIRPEQPLRLGGADVELVRQRLGAAQRGDEVVLQALCDQDREGHGSPSGC